MKLSLVVAQGAHSGKKIAIGAGPFSIGRDATCQLRPSSPSVSKVHCTFLVRDGKAIVRDENSTNGTFVNDAQIAGEYELKAGQKVTIGPLEFTVELELPAPVKAVAPSAKTVTAPKAAPKPVAVAQAVSDDPEHLAMMLLALDDGDVVSRPADATVEASVPDGATITDMPAVNLPIDAKKASMTREDSSRIAAGLLSQYMTRRNTPGNDKKK